MDFIDRNTRQIFASPHFAELSEDTLAFILQSDKLEADETAIYSAVVEWGTVNMVVSEKSMREVISKVIENVRFPLMSQDMLTKIETDNEKDQNIPVHLISKAWRYHATKKGASGDPAFRRRAGSAR